MDERMTKPRDLLGPPESLQPNAEQAQALRLLKLERGVGAFQDWLEKLAHRGGADASCAQALLDKHVAIFGRMS